jgi:hypothetical protein
MKDLPLYERTFEAYLIEVGIRSSEYTHSKEILYENIDYFKKCYEYNLSTYKALLFLENYVTDVYKELWFKSKDEIREIIRRNEEKLNFSTKDQKKIEPIAVKD